MGENHEPEPETKQLEEPSNLEKKIIRQIEHYFGDYNLCKDKFLKEQIKLDDGWVPLEIMVKFNRLKTLSEDYDVIVNAVKKSPNALMEVHEDGTKIRRRADKPLPNDDYFSHETQEARTLYVKGFKKTTTLDELLDYFIEHKAEYICMRRPKGNSKVFKGSCFIQFSTLEDSEKFLNTKGLKFQGMELLMEKKKDYVQRKDIFYNNLREEKEKKLAKRAEIKEEKDVGELKLKEVKLLPGCLLKVVGLSTEMTREMLVERLVPYGPIAFPDYQRGLSSGVIRFQSAVPPKILEEAIEEDGVKKMEFGSTKATIYVLEGEEEEEYRKTIAVSRARSLSRMKDFKQNKGRFGPKNWGKKRQKFTWNKDDEPSNKRIKTEVKTELNPEESTVPQEHNDEPPAKKIKTEIKVESNSTEPTVPKADSTVPQVPKVEPTVPTATKVE